VEVGWRYAVPLFVESWQYNRDWQKQLLRVIEAFQVRFDGDSKKRLQIFAKALGYYLFDIDDNRKVLLDELEKLAKRGWLDGDRKNERMAILFLQRGRLLYELERYSECLRIYIEAEKQLSETALHLRKYLAEEFSKIGYKFLWEDDHPIASLEAQMAYQSSVLLNPDNYSAWRDLGINYCKLEQYELAIDSLKKAINLDPKSAYPHTYLGNVYQYQGKHELAIASYQKAIDLDSQLASTRSCLGYLYLSQGNLEKAKSECIEAVNLDSKSWVYVMNLGFVSGLQGNQEEAITLWKQGLEILTGNSQNDRLFRALHEIGIGEIERGTNCLREILETEKPPLGILSDVLKDAELIAQFPTKLEGIDTVIEMLRQAIEKAQ
ncbi:MAG: tetratricopeptide repeat protein, partial [Pseudanabaena sp.]